MNSRTLQLAQQLIACPSVTPVDAGCQEIIARHLESAGFKIERLRYGEVDNLWARYGTTNPLFVFAGHADVVPPGPVERWQSHPFTPEVRDGFLYGRGAADMKGAVAAMIVACESFVERYPDHPGSVALLITGDEEGPAVNGTAKVIEMLCRCGVNIDWCLVGEPSSEERLGDSMKNGRRGSLSGRLKVYGQQGHVAYPQRADNPIHRFAAPLAELAAARWDSGNTHFPPTTFQVSNLNAGTGADNVIPGELAADFNFRYSTASTERELKERVHAVLDRHGLDYGLDWISSGEPFLTTEGELIAACRAAVKELTGLESSLSTAGGTSDGRFIAKVCPQVVELGTVNATIHKVDECVSVKDLETLTKIYIRILERLLI